MLFLTTAVTAQSPGSVELKVGAGGQVGITATPTPTPTLTSAPTLIATPTVTPVSVLGPTGFLTPTPVSFISSNQLPEHSVGATVGEFYLNLSGYSSPSSLISLVSDNVSLRSIVADEKGNFLISQVLIKNGFSNFCLKTTDFTNLGQSTTCITIAPVNSSITIDNIFLPPSLALWKNKIAYYESDLVFGYTMPKAVVVLHINPSAGGAGNDQTIITKANANGYYRFVFKFPSGKYDLFATAKYENTDSRAPSKSLTLEVLNWFGLLISMLRDLLNKLVTLFTSLTFGPLLIEIPIIILIIILLIKLWGKRFTSITAEFLGVFVLMFKSKKKLHHYWFVGY